jgi:hypothetical protein
VWGCQSYGSKDSTKIGSVENNYNFPQPERLITESCHSPEKRRRCPKRPPSILLSTTR